MQSDGFQQWGASASIQYGNPEGLGPTAQIRPIWGQAARRDFWNHYAVTNLAQESSAGRMDIELGYGTRSNEKSLVRPSLGTTLHSHGQGLSYRLQHQHDKRPCALTHNYCPGEYDVTDNH